ncbi:hypothetical protein CEP54_004898 [Fusarium duplospermum]|uniref:Uncharacterized protein n=1 Tax=Fusarium duplospermum TaxID=1325734 RepID=A0A428QFQ8_9HYPO|nr:hypothetical protein CEP54_004898 [Fusarium duplospermum]
MIPSKSIARVVQTSACYVSQSTRRTISNTSSHIQQPHRHRTPTPKKPRMGKAGFWRAAKEVLAEQERLFQALPWYKCWFYTFTDTAAVYIPHLVVYERTSKHDSKSKNDDYDDDD